MKKISMFLACLAICGASSANAATVNFVLDLTGPANTYSLKAKASNGDNAGLVVYSVELTGNGLTANHNSLRNGGAENAAGDSGPVGFTSLRTPDVAAATNAITFVGSQDVTNPGAHIIYSLGQESSNLAAKGLTPFGSLEGNPWESEMVIATGTYVGSAFDRNAIDFLPGGTLTVASVFSEVGSTSGILTADITTEIRLIPEPATFAIAGMGLIGLVGIARRRKA